MMKVQSLISATVVLGSALGLLHCGGGLNTDSTSDASNSLTPWIGTRQMGAAGQTTIGAAIAVDSAHSVYIGGDTLGNLDGNTLIGASDFFLTKYDVGGVKLWTRTLGVATKSVKGYGVAAGSAGYVYIAGSTTGGLDGNTPVGSTDYFLTQYTADGTKVRTIQAGASGAGVIANGVATDAAGNAYIVGTTMASLNGESYSGGGAIHYFAIKFDVSGARQWTKMLGASTETVAKRVAVDSTGRVLLAGYTSGNLGGNTQGTGLYDAFVTQYDSAGTLQWTKLVGVDGALTRATGIATDSNGNVYIGGETKGALDGNTGIGTAAGKYDAFLTCFNSAGVKQWTRQLGATGVDTRGKGVTVDAAGRIYLTGQTEGALPGNTLTGIMDSFVAQYDSVGNRNWISQQGAAGFATTSEDSAADPTASDRIFLAGYTNGGLAGNTLTGAFDIFVSLFNSAGIKQ